MEDQLNALIEKALEACNFALDSKNGFASFSGMDVLVEIKNRLLVYKVDRNVPKLREALALYKQSNMALSGEADYNSVWYKSVAVQGKSRILASIFDEMERISWDLINEPTER